MDLDNNAHSVFLLHYHLVLVVKYRRRVFNKSISNRAKEIFEYIAPRYNISLEEWNHDADHVHILFRAHPNTEISKFINAYKSASSRLLKKEFPEIRKKIMGRVFLEPEFLPSYHGWRTDRGNPEVYRKPGAEEPKEI